VDLGMTAKIPPAWVVSIQPADEVRALVTVVPHTTSVRENPLRSPVVSSSPQSGGVRHPRNPDLAQRRGCGARLL
jgi:hypothetical protein